MVEIIAHSFLRQNSDDFQQVNLFKTRREKIIEPIFR